MLFFAFIISFDCSYFTHNQFKQISNDVVFISPDVTQFLKLGEGENGLLSANNHEWFGKSDKIEGAFLWSELDQDQ